MICPDCHRPIPRPIRGFIDGRLLPFPAAMHVCPSGSDLAENDKEVKEQCPNNTRPGI